MHMKTFVLLIIKLKWVFIISALFFMPFIGDCWAEESTNTSLSWRGCDITKKAFMTLCVQLFEKESGITINISGGGAALGMRSVAGGSSDLGGSCRHASGQFESEKGGLNVP